MTEACDRAWVLYKGGRVDMALKELARELQSSPNSAFAHVLMALCHAGKGNYRKAREMGERGVSLNPSIGFSHYVLGMIFFWDTNYSSSRRGELLRDGNRLAHAARHLREAVRLEGATLIFLSALAFVCCEQSDGVEAIQLAQTGLAIDPQDGGCHRALALAYRDKGDLDAAVAESAKSLGCDPEEAVAHTTHGRLLLLTGEHQQAIQHFGEAMRLKPNSADARRGLIEGLRATHFIYRFIWRLIRWIDLSMSRDDPAERAGRVIAVMLMVPVLLAVIGGKYLGWAAHGRVILIAVGLLPAFSILAAPLWFNVIICANRDARHALSLRLRVLSWLVTGALIGAYGLLCTTILLGQWEFANYMAWFIVAPVGVVMLIGLIGVLMGR